MTPRRRSAEAGLTLIEMLVALALFAIIGAAGFSVLDQVIRVQHRAEGRLARLGELQRAMYLVTRDFTETTGGSLARDRAAVTFRRSAGSGDIAIRYDLVDGTLRRSFSPGFGRPSVAQALLSGVAALDWSFLTREGRWVGQWPEDPTAGPRNPVAVALDLTLSGPGLSGPLRRVAILPDEAAP